MLIVEAKCAIAVETIHPVSPGIPDPGSLREDFETPDKDQRPLLMDAVIHDERCHDSLIDKQPKSGQTILGLAERHGIRA